MSARAAVALTFASVVAGVLNYLYQVHAAVAMDAAQFGSLSAWLANVTLVSSIASVVQFLSLDFRSERFERLEPALGIISVVAIAGQLIGARSLGAITVGAIAVAGGILLYAVIGQLQGRLRLGDVGVALFAAGLARFALSYVTSFYVAHAIAAFAGVAAAAGAATFNRRKRTRNSAPPAKPSPRPSDVRKRLTRSVLLAFATVLFPQLDVLVLSWREDEATLGAFSRIALVARIVFFGGAAVLPVLLAHHVRAAEDRVEEPGFVAFAVRWLPPATIVSSLGLAFLSDRVVLHTSSDLTSWLFLSCASAALLVSILVHVQRLAARMEVVRAAACVVAVLFVSVLAAAVSQRSVTRYVLVACAGNALVLLTATMLASRPCRS